MTSLEIQPYLISTKRERGNKKAKNLTVRTNRERKIPEIQRVASNSEGGKKEYWRRKIQSKCVGKSEGASEIW